MNTGCNPLRDCDGATLIEMLVVMAILGVVALMGATSLLGIRERDAVQMTAVRLQDDVRLLQRRALINGYAWRLQFSPDKRSYALVEGTGCETVAPPTDYSRVIPSGVKLELTGATQQITFTCTGRRPATETLLRIKVGSTVAGQQYAKTVIVSPVAGQVSIQ